jgi:hypothetical protein
MQFQKKPLPGKLIECGDADMIEIPKDRKVLDVGYVISVLSIVP